MPRFTLQEIREARNIALDCHLKDSGYFCQLPIEEVQRICNGIGPEWMPEAARAILDRRHPSLKVPAMLHDVHYQYGTGTDEDFHAANHCLYKNGCIMAKEIYPWWNPVRYFVMHDAAKLANLCDLFGRKAYNEAIASRIRKYGK